MRWQLCFLKHSPSVQRAVCLVDGMPRLRAEAGSRPECELTFFRVAEKKVTKERAHPTRASLRCATGNLRCSDRGCAAELTARYALRSNNCGKSVHEVRVSFGTRTHPLPCASRHAQKGTQNGHPHGPLLRCAALGPVSRAQAPRAAQLGPSAAKARADVGCSATPPLLAAPAAGRLWGEHGRRSAHAS